MQDQGNIDPCEHLRPDDLDHKSVYKIMAGCIVPRPISLTTTVSPDGIRNAAPFSFFNMVSHSPPMVSLSFSPPKLGGHRKDTLANIESTGEFVVNIVGYDIAEAQDRCSETYGPEIDEIALTGLTAVPSQLVAPPRIAESRASFECRAINILPLPESRSTLVIGRVVMMHLHRSILLADHRIDHAALDAIGRMTGNSYCRTSDVFTLAHNAFDHLPGKPGG